ncbi:glycoside hydrolase superfamily [Terfezia claveryi]|nr:glycoside hydrolase superfamily [Terfezia claveryi]
MSNPLSQQHFPSSPTADDGHYSYPPPPPNRGLSVHRSIIHERPNRNSSPSPPPPEVTEPLQVHHGGQNQSLVQGHSSRRPVQGQVSRVPVGSKWGIGGDRDSREGVYSSVPSGDLEADFAGDIGIGAQQSRQKTGGRSRSPKKKDRMMPLQDNATTRGVEGGAATAVEEQTRPFYPGAHPDSAFSQIREHRRSVASMRDQYDPLMEDGEYDSPHSQGQNRGVYTAGTGGEGYSPSTTSSARGFATAGAPVGRTKTPEGQGSGGAGGQYPHPPQQQQYIQGENGGYFNQGGGYPHPQQQQYYNNGSSTSLHTAATLAGLPLPNAPHLTSNLTHPSNSSLHSQTSRRRSLPPAPAGAGIALIPADDSPYKRFSGIGGGSTTALGMDGQIDVNLLDENDPDDGLATPPPGGHGRAHGILAGLRGAKSNNNSGVLVGAGALGGAAGAVMVGGHGGDAADTGGLLSGGINTTAPVGENAREVGGGGSAGNIVAAGIVEKESDWLASQKHSKKKTRTIAIIIVLILLFAIAGGIAAGVILTKKKSSSKSSSDNSNSSNDSTDSNGGKTTTPTSSKDTGKWKDYLDNPALHKVFHGIDYTPLDSQYPECLDNPPTQAQVNIDVAIMSQLTTRVRLYGTDCNQAEMVLDGIKTTGVDMKIWLGIWLDYNATTNARSLVHMYDILDKYPASMFEGVVVGNESKRISLPRESTSPLAPPISAQNWDSSLASSVDVLMANIHPFFGGVAAVNATTWTMSFYDTNNLPKAKAAGIRGMISEVGWPTEGGTLQGSVAGVDELNTFLNDWVCQKIKDETEYFWFSAFDEPWKVMYNEAGKEWEDKWGLLDANRKLKANVVIPSCN